MEICYRCRKKCWIYNETFNVGGGTKNSISLKLLTKKCEVLTGNKLKNEETKFPISLMLNLLGDLWFRNGKQIEPKFEMIAGPGISIHLYGKAEPRIGRKMGHITILGLENQTQEDVIQKTDTLRKILLEN